MKKQLTAMLTALTLCLSAVPVTALAARDEIPGSGLPDWVPRDYASALDFCNTYGATHIQGGYVCLVRVAGSMQELQEDFLEECSQDPAERFTPMFVVAPRDEKDDGKEVSDWMEEPRYQFEVTLYHPKQTGELRIRWSTKNDPDQGVTYTFDVAQDGTITETDIYGWLPDCSTEFYAFDAANPAFSVHDGYIVYAGSPCHDGGYQEYISQIGPGIAEREPTRGIGRLYEGVPPCGGNSSVIRVYRPVRAGRLRMTATEKRSWETQIICSDTAYFVIDEQLNVTETVPFEECYGDCNGDGELSVQDLVALCRYLHGKGTLAHPELADLDGDGQVDIYDFAALQRELILQSPWKDGSQEFTCETVVNHSPRKEHNDYEVRQYGMYDAVHCFVNDFDNAYAVSLSEITEETFKDHAVLTIASPVGAGDRRVEVERIERRGSRLIFHTRTLHSPAPTPDMAVIFNVCVLDQNAVDGISEMIVENQDLYQQFTSQDE